MKRKRVDPAESIGFTLVCILLILMGGVTQCRHFQSRRSDNTPVLSGATTTRLAVPAA